MKNQHVISSSLIKYLLIVTALITSYACNSSINLLKSNNHALNKSNFTDTINIDFHNNRIIIPVEIAGKSYQFLFDTGAPTIILGDLQQELNNTGKKTTKQINMRGIDGVIGIHSMRQIEQISIGDRLRFDNVWVVEDNNGAENILNSPCKIVDGVIGSDLFRHYNFELDIRNKRMIVSDKEILPSTDGTLNNQ